MKKFLLISALATVASASFGQFASVDSFAASTTAGSGGAFSYTGGYQQNFDSLSATPGSVTGSSSEISTLPGWYLARTGASALGYASGTGSGNSGSHLRLATSGSGDVALGTLRSGSYNPSLGVVLRNNTGTNTGLAILSLSVEQFRHGGGNDPSSFRVSFRRFAAGSNFASTSANLFVPGASGWTTTNISYQTTTDGFATVSSPVASNVLPAPINTGTATALDGNLPANRRDIRIAIELFALGQSWNAGDDLAIRFEDVDATSGSQGAFAIDNLQVVPEPASMAVLGLGILGLARRRRNK